MSTNYSTYLKCLELIRKYNLKGQSIFDAHIVATMIENGIEVIATNNEKDFRIFKEIQILNPLH